MSQFLHCYQTPSVTSHVPGTRKSAFEFLSVAAEGYERGWAREVRATAQVLSQGWDLSHKCPASWNRKNWPLTSQGWRLGMEAQVPDWQLSWGKWVTGAEVMELPTTPILEKLSWLLRWTSLRGGISFWPSPFPRASLICVEGACHGFPSPHINSESKGMLILSSVIWELRAETNCLF